MDALDGLKKGRMDRIEEGVVDAFVSKKKIRCVLYGVELDTV